MNALEFVYGINKFRSGYNAQIFQKENTLDNIKLEFGSSISDEEVSKIFLKREYLYGSKISLKEGSRFDSENQIEFLVWNFRLILLDRLINGISFLEEILILDDELFVFGTLDSYLCYDNEGAVGWIDYDTHELLSKISNSPDEFLDCMFTVAENNITGSLNNIDLLNKLVYLSGTNESGVFFKYLIGIDT